MGQPVYIIFNPQAGKGRGATLVAPTLSAFQGSGKVDHGLTSAAGDEARLAREAIGRGFRRIVAVGGDGTWSNVANGILETGERGVSLGLVPGGTGCDFAKSLGIPAKNLAGCAAIAQGEKIRTIDVGKVEGKYFLNIAGFGFDIAVIEDSWKVWYLGGDLLYLYCALRQIYRFPGFSVELSADGVSTGTRELLMLTIANGRVFGGGFQIAPSASLEDGQLDVVSFGNMKLGRRLAIMAALLKGQHAAAPEVSTTLGRRFVLNFGRPPAYETDGEWNQARSSTLEVESIPRALSVLAPPA